MTAPTPTKFTFNPLSGNFDKIMQDAAQIVTVAKSGAMYSTIQAAINAITDASSTKQYVVEVGPGVYTENVTSKDYVFVQNGLSGAVKIVGSFTATGLSGVAGTRGVTIEYTATGDNQKAVNISGGTFYFVDMDVYLLGAANYILTGVYASSGTAFTVFNSTVWDRRSGTITKDFTGWKFAGAGTFGIFNASTSARAAYSSGNNCMFTCSSTGSFTASGGAAIWASSVAFSGEVRGWCVDSVSASPRIVSGTQVRISGTSGGTGTGFHINSGGSGEFQHVNSTLFITGTTTSNMCDTAATDTQKIFQLSTNKYLTKAGTGVTIITPYALTQTGFVEFGGSGNYWSYNTGTGSFTLLRQGSGLVRSAPVTWAFNQSTAIVDKSINYVYIDSTGTIGVTQTFTDNLYADNILLYEVWRNGTNYMVSRENHPCDFPTRVSGAWHNLFGPLLQSSSTVLSSVNTRQIAVTGANVINDHGITSTVAAATGGATWTVVYTAASGEMQQYSTATADLPEYYNLAGTPTIMTVGSNRWGIYRLGVIKDKYQDGTETAQYVAVMDTQQQTSSGNATTRINSGLVTPFPAEMRSLEVVQLGYAVVRKTNTGAIDTSNVPPTTLLQVFGAAFVGGGTSTSASLITANTTNFGSELSGADTDLQQIADRIDDFDSLLDWGTGKAYRVGNVVRITTEGFIGEWRCVTAHTASAAVTTDINSGYWEIVSNSEGSRELVNATSHGFVAGDVLYSNAGTYAKAKADLATTAEVVGIVAGATTNYFVLAKTGKVTKTGWALTAGAVYFLSDATAGLITSTEPTTVSNISKPVGIAASTTALQVFNMRGQVIGGTNAFSNQALSNNAATTIYTITDNAGEGGMIQGRLKITTSSGTNYTAWCGCSYTRQQDGTTYNVGGAFFDDALPSGTYFDNSGSALRLVLPSVTNFSSASIRWMRYG